METTKDIPFIPSTLEHIDTALYEWVDQTINVSTETNSGWKKTPCIWLSSERAYQAKNDREIRDSIGKLKLPLITVTRTAVEKPSKKGPFVAPIVRLKQFADDHRNGQIIVKKVINQEKTRNFTNKDLRNSIQGVREGGTQEYTGKSNNRKIVYEKVTMPAKTYVTMTYTITLRSEYQQQMNTMLQPFLVYTQNINSFKIVKDGHLYEGFIQESFSDGSNRTNLGEDERKFERKVEVKVLGYLMGEGDNSAIPKVETYETSVEVRISKERVIIGDRRPWAKDDGKYRE